MSKGSTPRPIEVDMLVYKNNWDVIFKKPQAVQTEADKFDALVIMKPEYYDADDADVN